MATIDGPGSNTLLDDLAEVSADEVEELDNEIDQKDAFLNKLPPCAQWMARLPGKYGNNCGVNGRLSGFFNENVLHLQDVG